MSISTSNLPDSLIHLQNFVEETDHDGVLRIISYKKCNNSSNEDVKACRGAVYDGNKLLFPSLGYTDEYNIDKIDTIDHFDLKTSYIFPSYEGTLLRVFYHQTYNKWYVATHRKLDAFHSKWLAKDSFGDQFQQLIVEMTSMTFDTFLNTLDRGHVYLFLLRPLNENRLVSNAPSQSSERLLHVGTYKNGTELDFEYTVQGLSKPYRLMFSSLEELKTYVKEVDFHQQQGVIIFYKKDEMFKNIKLMNPVYHDYASVRGNEHNLLFRYLQIRNVPSYYKMLLEIYPERVNEFYFYDSIILQIAKRIHRAYMERFVNKKYVVVTPLEYQIVKDVHGWHRTDRNHNKVTLIHVLETLGKQDYVSILNTLIKMYL